MKSNRRNFIKYAGLGSASVLFSPLINAAPDNIPGPIQLRRYERLKDSLKTDVLVIGAGASGVPAAIAAARGGASVILIEDDLIPGGAPVDNYVSMLCGGPRVGIFKEMVDMLDRDYDMTKVRQDQRWYERWFMPSAWLRVISDKMNAEKNLRFMGGSPVVNVLISEGENRNNIRGVRVFGKDGRMRDIEAKVVIDATGSGIVATLAGCEYFYGSEAKSIYNEPIGPEKSSDEVQLCTLMMVSQRLDPAAKIDLEKLTNPRDPAVGLVGREPLDEIYRQDTGTYLQWAGTVRCKDTRDPDEVNRAQSEALEAIEEDVAYLYENGYVAHIAPKLGVREIRRIVGEKIFTVNDLINPSWPDDVVATGNYGLDSWGASYLKDHEISLPDAGYGLPYSMFITKGMENLFVVGKCVSSTHLGMSAIRVQPIAAQMGEAAGTAAGMAVKNNTDIRSIEVAELQEKLRKSGLMEGRGGRMNG